MFIRKFSQFSAGFALCRQGLVFNTEVICKLLNTIHENLLYLTKGNPHIPFPKIVDFT